MADRPGDRQMDGPVDHPVDRQVDHPVGYPVDHLVEPVGCSMAVAVRGRPQAILCHRRFRGSREFWMVVEPIGRVEAGRST